MNAEKRETVALGRFMAAMAIVLPGAYVATVNWAETYDDAFITYRYAYNLAAGRGLTYNVGEWYLGTTAPGYALLLGGLGVLTSPEAIPVISGWLSGMSLLLTGLALLFYGWHAGRPYAGLLGGLFYVTNPLLSMSFGGEMLFQVMLVSWVFVLYQRDRTVYAAFLLALAIITRPDALVAAGVIGLHYFLTRRKLPLREVTVAALIVLPFALVIWWLYGTPVPGTLAVKSAHMLTGIWQPFIIGGLEWLKGFTLQGGSTLFRDLPAIPSAARFIVLVAVGIPATLVFFRYLLLPLSWVGAYVIAYWFLHMPFYHWYLVPVIYGLMALAGAGVAGGVEAVRIAFGWWAGQRRAGTVALGVFAVCLVILSPGLRNEIDYIRRRAASEPHPGERLYERVGRWLAATALPTDSVGYFEIGIIGYYSQRPMVDALGLVNPGVASHVAAGEFTWAYQHYRPTYVLTNDLFPEISQVTREQWFQQEYRLVTSMSEPGYPVPVVIYQRSHSAR